MEHLNSQYNLIYLPLLHAADTPFTWTVVKCQGWLWTLAHLWSFESDYIDAGYNYLQIIVLGHWGCLLVVKQSVTCSCLTLTS